MALAQCATAIGSGVIADQDNQIALGSYNNYETCTHPFMVGCGTKATRANILSADDKAVYGKTFSANGADYAEYFEWKDGNIEYEDRIGYAVTLDGNKIIKANSNDEVLGIISGNYSFLGDNPEWEWQGKYLKDNFGRTIYEEVEEFDDETGEFIGMTKQPKINPDYDESQQYIRRSERPEWDVVGMLGKIHARDDGTCELNKYAKVKENGILTSSDEKTNMRVLSRVSDNVIIVLLK
jgi:hypothetical protein